MKQLADSEKNKQPSNLGEQIGALHQAKLSSADELASILEPRASSNRSSRRRNHASDTARTNAGMGRDAYILANVL